MTIEAAGSLLHGVEFRVPGLRFVLETFVIVLFAAGIQDSDFAGRGMRN